MTHVAVIRHHGIDLPRTGQHGGQGEDRQPEQRACV